MEREHKPSQVDTRRKPRMYFGKPHIAWEMPRRKKPRMYWGEPRYEGYSLIIYPRQGIYKIGHDIFPLRKKAA